MSHYTKPEKRKARKPHRCSWCDEMIKKGELHEAWTMFDDGRADTVRVHIECGEAIQDVYDDEWEPGGHSRGCTCEHGECTCGKNPALTPTPAKPETPQENR